MRGSVLAFLGKKEGEELLLVFFSFWDFLTTEYQPGWATNGKTPKSIPTVLLNHSGQVYTNTYQHRIEHKQGGKGRSGE